MIEPLGFPTEFVSALSAGEASERAGLRLSRGGLWLPDCAVAEPAMLCRQWLSDPAITLHCKRCVDFLRPDGDGWAAFDADGALLATAPVVLLCNAQQAHRLTPVPHLTLAATLGQTSTLRPVAASDPGAGAAALNCVLSDEGYLVPGVGGDAGLWQSGSTYHPLDSPSAAREASAFATDDDRRNLERAARLIGPQAPALTVADHHQGVRWSAPDHLPLIGAAPDALQCHRQAAELARNDRLPLPRLHGVFQAFGFGSRGLLWSVLAGEVLAAAIEGEPAPIETDLLQAIDPARFPRRALRRAASR